MEWATPDLDPVSPEPEQPEPSTTPTATATATIASPAMQQWDACAEVWWRGAAVEGKIAFTGALGWDVSYSTQQFRSIRHDLESNCKGVGKVLASDPQAAELCESMLGVGVAIAAALEFSEKFDISTFSLEFAEREVDGFIAAACWR